jgi:non-ribosomal peptide synthetase component E (peptide arylation enzyme)
MIVGAASMDGDGAARTTLDDLFRRAAVRNPDAIALVDPDDRAQFTDGAPRQLTYAQADRAVWAMAERLRALGLQTDAVIGVQLPNTVEHILTLLGIIRAGLIAAPLPMLWRETEIIAALSNVGAKALVTTSRIGAADHCAVAGRVAAGLFSIRHVCAFGDHLADGIVPLDDVFSTQAGMQPAPMRDGNPAVHAALVTFEPSPRGLLPVVRNHLQLIAAGAAIVTDGGLVQECALLSATPPSSFAGLAVTLMPWLLTGGRLVLHQPFDHRSFRDQIDQHGCDTIVLPGPIAPAFDDISNRVRLIALWRRPERSGDELLSPTVLDVTAFGEFGLHAALRQHDRRMAPLTLGPIRAAATDTIVLETRRGPKGTLLLRGGMIAAPGFAAAQAATEAAASTDDFADTGYPCRADVDRGALTVTGPQPGTIGIGGYRLARNELDAISAALPTDSPIAALPDNLLGQRLRGRAADAAAARLAARAANPLIAGAFQGR